MKNFTGFETTEDEFDSLPLAVRRKVCIFSSVLFNLDRILGKGLGINVVVRDSSFGEELLEL